jgi:hypothetical protein
MEQSENEIFDEERQLKLFEDIDEMHCRGIWAAVLVQACIDARSACRKRESIKVRAEALAWLSDSDEDGDLAIACELAGIDPQKFRESLRRYLHPKHGLDFHCVRKGRPQKRTRNNVKPTNEGENYDRIQQQTNQDDTRRQHQSRHLGESERIRSHVSQCRPDKKLQGGRRVA